MASVAASSARSKYPPAGKTSEPRLLSSGGEFNLWFEPSLNFQSVKSISVASELYNSTHSCLSSAPARSYIISSIIRPAAAVILGKTKKAAKIKKIIQRSAAGNLIFKYNNRNILCVRFLNQFFLRVVRMLQPQMLICRPGRHSSPRSAADKTQAQQIGFVNIFYGVLFFIDRRGQRL